MFPVAYLFNTGHGTGYGFEIINMGYGKPLGKNSRATLGYLMYGRSGAILGYGSWIALIPEFKFGKHVQFNESRINLLRSR